MLLELCWKYFDPSWFSYLRDQLLFFILNGRSFTFKDIVPNKFLDIWYCSWDIRDNVLWTNNLSPDQWYLTFWSLHIFKSPKRSLETYCFYTVLIIIRVFRPQRKTLLLFFCFFFFLYIFVQKIFWWWVVRILSKFQHWSTCIIIWSLYIFLEFIKNASRSD